MLDYYKYDPIVYSLSLPKSNESIIVRRLECSTPRETAPPDCRLSQHVLPVVLFMGRFFFVRTQLFCFVRFYVGGFILSVHDLMVVFRSYTIESTSLPVSGWYLILNIINYYYFIIQHTLYSETLACATNIRVQPLSASINGRTEKSPLKVCR